MTHHLVKTEIRENKKGKKYHKTNNCVVCKNNGLRKQTTYVCAVCNVSVCYPSLTERHKAPTNCFRVYHERMQMQKMYSNQSSDEDTEKSAYDSEDDFIETDKKKISKFNIPTNIVHYSLER